MDNEKSGSQIPVDKHIIKKCKIDQTKMRKEHNKKSRNMVETAIGNLKSTSINKLTLVEREEKNSTDKGREMDWSSGEHGIDERIGKLQYLIHPKKRQ